MRTSIRATFHGIRTKFPLIIMLAGALLFGAVSFADAQAQEKPQKVKLGGTFEVLGGGSQATVPGASAYVKPGASLIADLSLLLPLGWQQVLILNGGFAHDDFRLKTAYYPVGQAYSAARILERMDTFSTGVDWQAGSRQGLFSDLGVSGSYRIAEIPGDTSWDLRASERVAWRKDESWRLGLGLDFQYLTFPSYTAVSGRGLDYYKVGTSPDVTWYLSPDLNLGLAYDFTFRQYLNSKYDQLVSLGPPLVTIPATLDKQYFTHGASLTLRASPGAVFRPMLRYSFVYNKTVNYDDKVTGLPANMFAAGKGDYFEHEVRAGSRFNWTRDFTTTIGAALIWRSYLNYPVQDTTGTFTGDMRRDLDLHLDGEMQYVLWKQKANGIGDVIADLRVSYRSALSNHTYTSLVQGNYQTIEAVAGVVLRLL